MGTLPFFLGGCGAFSFLPWVGEEEEKVVVLEVDPAAEGGSPAEAPGQAPFDAPPVESGTPPQIKTVAPGLIRPTDPQARAKAVASGTGRPDPFSAIPTTPRIRPTVKNVPNQETSGRNPQSLPPLPRVSPPPQPTTQGGSAAGNNGSGGGNSASPTSGGNNSASPTPGGNNSGGNGSANPSNDIPSIAKGPDFIPDLPAVPQPTVAQRVRVTGAIKIGGVSHAILEAPGQQPRYVKVGDYVANGQVLVKRIEMNGGFDPVVILEQAGVEVAKRVGEGVPGETVDGSESASVPNSAAQS